METIFYNQSGAKENMQQRVMGNQNIMLAVMFNQGFSARLSETQPPCPHDIGTEAYKAWKRGYNEAGMVLKGDV